MHDPGSTDLDAAHMGIRGKEIIDIYAFLKKREHDLTPPLRSILRQAERILYEHLSIDEMEKLQQ